MPVNILVVGLNERCINIVLDEKLSVDILKENISTEQCVDASSFFLTYNGTPLEDSDNIETEDGVSTLIVRAYPTIKGGKGGFGTLIRSMGSHGKTTNKGACRDLSGRRMRDVKTEQKLSQWVKEEPERKRKKAEEKRKKRQKLLSGSKHYFNDPEYMDQKRTTEENMDDALKQGLEAACSSSQGVKRKLPAESGPSKKTKIWLGVDEAEFDSDTENENDEEYTPEDSSASRSSSTPPDTEEIPETIHKNGDTLQADCPAISQGSCSSSGDQTSTGATSSDNNCETSESPKSSIKRDSSPVPSGEDRCAKDDSSEQQSKEHVCLEPVNLKEYSSAVELEAAGAERIKLSLQAMGLKCGGTLQERAVRLFSTKGKTLGELDSSLFANGGKKGKRKNVKL